MLRLENCPISEDESYARELKSPRIQFASMQYARRRTVQRTFEQMEKVEQSRVRSQLKRQMRRVKS